MIVGILAACVLAVVVWLFVDPIRVTLRAPDHGDVFALKVRHTALSADAWLGTDASYGILGHVVGIPFDTRHVARLIRRWRSRPKDEQKDEPALEKPAKEGIPWGKVALERRGTVLKAFRIDLLEVDLEYGTGDPVSTGLISGALWQICMLLPEHARIDAEPCFTEERFHLEGEGRVSIFPWRVIVAGLSLAIGGFTWRTRTAKATSSSPQSPASSPMAGAAPPPSPSSRSS